jgi:hypothetical protein
MTVDIFVSSLACDEPWDDAYGYCPSISLINAPEGVVIDGWAGRKSVTVIIDGFHVFLEGMRNPWDEIVIDYLELK